MSKSTRIFLGAISFMIGLWLFAPTLVIIPLSFSDKKSLAFPPTGYSLRWYENFFSNPSWLGSLVTSLELGLVVAIVSTVLGTAAALGLEKVKVGAGLIKGFLLVPIIIPGIVLAIGIYAVFLDLRMVGTYWGFTLAHSMLAIPYVVIAVSANLKVFDVKLPKAAASLGANPWTSFRLVTLPLILPGILSGALFAFVTSFDEVIVALFINSPYLKTLPVQIFTSIIRDTDPTVAAIGTMIFLVTTLIIVGALLVGERRKESNR